MDHAARCWMLLGVPLSAACFVGLPLGHCSSQSPSSHSLELGKHFLLSPSPDLSVMYTSVLAPGISFWTCFVSPHPTSHIPSPHIPHFPVSPGHISVCVSTCTPAMDRVPLLAPIHVLLSVLLWSQVSGSVGLGCDSAFGIAAGSLRIVGTVLGSTVHS